MATVYAEEMNVTAREMPVVNLFGEYSKQMFLDMIYAVGSYGEMYNRTLEATFPRSGANRLNENLEGPQQFPVPFV